MNIIGTNGSDILIFSGHLQHLGFTMVNPYTQRDVVIDDEYNVNNATYYGLNGTDRLLMTVNGDALFLEDESGQQRVFSVEIIFANDQGDIVNFASTAITYGNVTILGGLGDDIVWSNVGNDSLDGADGHDDVDGGPGNDRLVGGAGNDLLHGGTGNDVLIGGTGGDDSPFTTIQTVEHNFAETMRFPTLIERQDIQNLNPPGTTNLGIYENDLGVPVQTTATLTMVHSGAGYNNTLGAYTIGADGTIHAVEFAFTNVKNGLYDSSIAAFNKSIASIEKNITSCNKSLATSHKKVAASELVISNNETKIHDLQIKLTAPGVTKSKITSINKQIATLEKTIATHEATILAETKKITGYEKSLATYEANLAARTAEKASFIANFTDHYVYTLDGEQGKELGTFIIADGDRVNNKYQGLDLENGELQFVYKLGQGDERLAKITDSSEDVSLVLVNGSSRTVLSGNIYHSTERGASTAINADHAEHVVSGLANPDDDGTLRIGFEDLKNLGDADFNDVVFDVKISTAVVVQTVVEDNDILHGGDGDDVLFGGHGIDILFGGAGADTFLFKQFDESVDIIKDFQSGIGGDNINVTELLSGYSAAEDAIGDFVSVRESGGHTIISVDADGGGDKYVDIAVIEGGLGGKTVQNLLDDGNLIANSAVVV